MRILREPPCQSSSACQRVIAHLCSVMVELIMRQSAHPHHLMVSLVHPRHEAGSRLLDRIGGILPHALDVWTHHNGTVAQPLTHVRIRRLQQLSRQVIDEVGTHRACHICILCLSITQEFYESVLGVIPLRVSVGSPPSSTWGHCFLI